MNKKTVALTEEQYNAIINLIREGTSSFKPNDRVATCLVIEANLGIRISDVLQLRFNSIIQDGSDETGSPRYRLNIIEQKTKKKRTFSVPIQVRNYLQDYANERNLRPNEILFPITSRQVQKILKKACDYLGYTGISTHSFRKFYITNIYNAKNHDIKLCQLLLQHSSSAITERYIEVSPERIESAIQENLHLL